MMPDGGSFAVVGGYGLLGRLTARLLIRDGARAVTIAGRNVEKASKTAKEIAPMQGRVDVKAKGLRFVIPRR